MRKLIVPLMALGMFCTVPMLAGCDKEVAKDSKTTVSPNGDTTKTETTVKEKPNGDVVQEHHDKTTNTNNP